MECGDDGCGDSCGACVGPQEVCTDGLCACVPECAAKECGDDGCGGSCGSCTGLQEECSAGLCTCVPDCFGKICGEDGCGDLCGSCEDFLACTSDGCVDGACSFNINPTNCLVGGVCYDDGDLNLEVPCQQCSAGTDQDGWTVQADGIPCDGAGVCNNGSCCYPADNCTGKDCGSDGCGGMCGLCTGQEVCLNDLCQCIPDCTGKECGDDGCGGSCGICPGPQDFCSNGICNCAPECTGIECGDDGCNGSCGACPGPQDVCSSGVCTCQPDCIGKSCGDDGCTGSCGACNDGIQCTDDSCNAGTCEFLLQAGNCLISGACVPDGQVNATNVCESCQPTQSTAGYTPLPDGTSCGVSKSCYLGQCCDYSAACTGKQCGDNGCGGVCGTCKSGKVCDEATGKCKWP